MPTNEETVEGWKLTNEVSLDGIVREITMMELRQHPGDVMTAVELGATFVVKRADRIMAVITAPKNTDLIMVIGGSGETSYQSPRITKQGEGQ